MLSPLPQRRTKRQSFELQYRFERRCQSEEPRRLRKVMEAIQSESIRALSRNFVLIAGEVEGRRAPAAGRLHFDPTFRAARVVGPYVIAGAVSVLL